MSKNVGITAQLRSERGKSAAQKIRSMGKIPAIVYGKDQESIALTIDAKEADQLFSTISVENTIVNVKIDDEEMETLVREIQTHPFRPDLIHVDFYRIQRGVAIEVDVPINYLGTPEGAKHGGVLDVILRELRVKCIPSKIPETIEVEVTSLEIGQSIHANEIEIEDDVELLTDPVRTLCLVALPKEEIVPEEEEELEDGVDVAEEDGDDEGESPAAETDDSAVDKEDSDD